MKIKIIGAIAAILVVTGGYFGYLRYEQHKFVESITPHVKNASLRLANAVRYETEKDSKITYKELFEKLESDVSEIDKRILDVQTIATPSNKEITDPVLTYLKSSQELIRAILMKYRKQLALSSASDWVERALDDLRSANSYGREYAIKASDKAMKDFEKASKEYDEARAEVLPAVTRMREAYANAAKSMSPDILANPSIFEAVAKQNDMKKTKSIDGEGKK